MSTTNKDVNGQEASITTNKDVNGQEASMKRKNNNRYYDCICGKSIRSDKLKAHQYHCIECRDAREEQLKEENAQLKEENAQLKEANNEIQKEIQRMKDEQLKELKQEIKKLKKEKSPSMTIHNMTMNTTNMTANMNITPYNRTPLPDETKVKRMLDEIKTTDHAKESLPKYIKLKHFEKDETRNIRLPNVRGNTVQVVETTEDGKKWVEKNKKDVLDEMTDKGMNELIDFGAECISTWNDWYTKSNLDKDGYDKTTEFKNLKERNELLLRNER